MIMKRIFPLLLFFLSINISLAQINTDNRTDNASVFQARNGINVINIAKPNPNGISKNTYTDFNISSEGVVFNNSTSEGRSRLAGIILGNSNYTIGDSARLILNQVTSSNSSSLEGFGEVFGSNAGVIIANPNGISCSGCGFINASQVSLITGTVNDDSISSGNPTFNINNDNKITISGDGFNGSEVDYLNLVSRYHSIQAQITAKEKIRILSGNNTYDSNNFTLNSTTGVAQNGEFAVDISALANMQAGSIIVIGTEKGLGVNSQGRVVASLSGVEIDSAGKMVLNEIISTQNITLKSQAGITTTANSYLQAGGSINIEAGDIALNSLLAYGDFTASTDGNFSILTHSNAIFTGNINVFGNTTILANNFENSGDINSRSLNITTNNDFSNYKNITTSSLNITSENVLNEGNIRGEFLNIHARNSFDNSSGSIYSNFLGITTNSFNNKHDATINTSLLYLTIDKNFTSSSNTLNGVNFNDLALTVSGDFYNYTNITADSLFIATQHFDNFAKLRANNLTIITYADYSASDNSGEITANNLYLNNSNFSNDNNLLGFNFKNLSITTTNDFHNYTNITADSLWILAKNNFYNYNTANISSDSLSLIVHNNFSNDGDINADIAALAVINTFANNSDGNITGNQLNIITSKNYNYGNIQASTLDIRADYLDNTGDITANNLNILVYERFYNKDRATITASNLLINAKWLENHASISASTLDIETARFVNSETTTADLLYIITDHFYNYKNIDANNFILRTNHDFENYGDIRSDYVGFTVEDSFENKGKISANILNLFANDFYNDASASIHSNYSYLIIRGFNINGGNFDNYGDIHSEELIVITNYFNNYGDIYSNFFDSTVYAFMNNNEQANIKVKNFNLDTYLVDNSGDIYADNFNVKVFADFNNHSIGNIDASSFLLTSSNNNTSIANNFLNLGNINSNLLDILLRDSFTNSGDGSIRASNIKITADNFTNRFSDISADILDITSNYNFFNLGNIDASSLNLIAFNFFNESNINANDFDATIDVYFYNYGNIQADYLSLIASSDHNYGSIIANTLDVFATNFYNYTTGDIKANSLNITTNNDLITSGDIQASDLTLIITNDFYNNGNIIIDSSTSSYANIVDTGTIDTGIAFNQTIPYISTPTISLTPTSTLDIATIPEIYIPTPVIPINNFTAINFSTIATQDLSYSYNPNLDSSFTIQPLSENNTYKLETRADFYEFSEIITDGFTNTSIQQYDIRLINVINIAKPDANGLSNNTYESFHIPIHGIVFNNSDVLKLSILAGAIYANPNYVTDDSAKIILNQITSNNQTYLEGTGEILGESAALIIANPNGITCSGCGFLNTDRVDLITGTSNFNLSQELVDFNIGDSGTIIIGDNYILNTGDNYIPNGEEIIKRSGLDGVYVDNLNLASRYYDIQTSIRTKELNIFSGNYKYNYANTNIDSTNAAVSGEFAINISPIASLYANSITLTSTEIGLGTYSAGSFISSSGDITINSVGKLHLTDITSSQDIHITSQAGLTTSSNSDFKAGKNINIDAAGISLYSILAYGKLTASTDGDFQNHSNLRAENFAIRASVATLGDITADRNFEIITQANTNLVGSLSIFGDATITTNNYNQSGTLYADKNLNITVHNSASFDASAEFIGNHFIFNGANLYNQGIILGDTLDISVDDIINQNKTSLIGAKIEANNLNLTANNFTNQNNATIKGSTLDITVNNNFLNDNSTIIANQITANLFNFTNQGENSTISAYQQLILTVTNDFENKETATIGANQFTLKATNGFKNKENAIIRGNILDIITKNFVNDANIEANNYSVTADNFTNKGNIFVYRDFNLVIKEYATNEKEIQTGSNLNIVTQNFTNKNLIIAGDIDIQTTGNFLNQTNNNSTSSIYSYGNILFTGGVSTDGSYLKSNDFTNEGGWIEARQDLEIHSKNILNKPFEDVTYDTFPRYQDRGYWVFEEAIHSQLEKNRGRIYSGRNMKLVAEKDISNNYSYIHTNNLTIDGSSFNNPSYKIQKSSEIHTHSHYRDVCGFIKEFSWKGVKFRWRCEREFYEYTYSQDKAENIGEIISIVDGGGNISGSLTDLFSNGTLQEGKTPNEQNDAGNGNDVAEVENNFSNQTVAINALFLSSNPLFSFNLSSDGNNYTIEKRSIFTRLEEFFGSDHFCNQTGVCPVETSETSFADAELQTTIFNEQLTQLGLSAYAEDGNLSYADMFDAFSGNSADVMKDLNLEFGKPLTEDQIDLLTKDIVWFVPFQIDGKDVLDKDGKKILVPRLYISKLTREKIDADGSVFSARRISVVVRGDTTKPIDEKEKNQFSQDIIDRMLSVGSNANNSLELTKAEDDLYENLTDEQKDELEALIKEKKDTAEAAFEQAREDKIKELKAEIKKYEDESVYENAAEIQANLQAIIVSLSEDNLVYDEVDFIALVRKIYLITLRSRGEFVNSGTFRASDGFTVYAGDINNYSHLQAGTGGFSLVGIRDVNIESLAYSESGGGQTFGGVYTTASIESEGVGFVYAGQNYNQIGANVTTNGQDYTVYAENNIVVDGLAVRNRRESKSAYYEVEENTTTYLHSSINLGSGNFKAKAGGNAFVRSHNDFFSGSIIAKGGKALLLNPRTNEYSRKVTHHDPAYGPLGFLNSSNEFLDFFFGTGDGDRVEVNQWNDTSEGYTTNANNIYIEGNQGIVIGADIKTNILKYHSKNGLLELLTIAEYNTNYATEFNKGLLYQKDKRKGNARLDQRALRLSLGKIDENSSAQGTVINYGKEEKINCKTKYKRTTDSSFKHPNYSLEYLFGGWERVQECSSESKENAQNRIRKNEYVGQFEEAASNSNSPVYFNSVPEFNLNLDYNHSRVTPEAQQAAVLAITFYCPACAPFATAMVYGGSNVINSITRKGSDLGGFKIDDFSTAIAEGTLEGVVNTAEDPNFWIASAEGYIQAELLKPIIEYSEVKIEKPATDTILGGFAVALFKDNVEKWDRRFEEPKLEVPNVSELYEYLSSESLSTESAPNNVFNVEDYLRSIGILPPENP